MSDDYTPEVHNPIWDGYDLSWQQRTGTLPIRGEKRLIPVFDVFPTKQSIVPETEDEGSPVYEAITFAKRTLTDYMLVRIPNRQSNSNTDGVFTFRFLINPKTVSISRQTLDSHSMARGGYQFGIWGEDTIDIHLNGQTAGQYFQSGLTDSWERYS